MGRYGRRGILVGVTLGLVLAVAAVAAPGHAGEGDTRVGYGTLGKDGRMDLYDLKGNRVGSGQRTPVPATGGSRP